MKSFSGKDYQYYHDGSCTPSVANFSQESNVGIPGKWVFRLDGLEIESSKCGSNKTLQISPSFVSIFGMTPIALSGPCVNESSKITITFFDEIKGKLLILKNNLLFFQIFNNCETFLVRF